MRKAQVRRPQHFGREVVHPQHAVGEERRREELADPSTLGKHGDLHRVERGDGGRPGGKLRARLDRPHELEAVGLAPLRERHDLGDVRRPDE